jgi:hypothetical protein
MIAPKMPSRTLDKIDISTRIVPVQKAFSLFTRRSHTGPSTDSGLELNAATWSAGRIGVLCAQGQQRDVVDG